MSVYYPFAVPESVWFNLTAGNDKHDWELNLEFLSDDGKKIVNSRKFYHPTCEGVIYMGRRCIEDYYKRIIPPYKGNTPFKDRVLYDRATGESR